MTNSGRKVIFFFSFLLVSISVVAQRNSLSVGPMLSIGRNEPGIKDKKGFGVGAEYYHRFFSQSGLRAFTGYEEFSRAGYVNDRASYFSFRAGYQHYLAKNRLMVWGDAGFAKLRFILGGEYDLFTFSAGGGYTLPISGHSFLQFQGFYVYTDSKKIPFGDTDFYGWGTFRVAYGLNFGRPAIPPNSSKF